MANIKLDLKNTGITQKLIMEYKEEIENIHKQLHKRRNPECREAWPILLLQKFRPHEQQRGTDIHKKQEKETNMI